MFRKPFLFAIVCVSLCFILVLTLYVFAEKPNEKANGFNRILPAYGALLQSSLPLKYPAYYFAGQSDARIYLGNYSASAHLLTVQHSFSDTQELKLKIPSSERYAWKLARVMVDSPFVYVTEGSTPSLFRGHLGELDMKRFLPQSCYFNALQTMSPGSFASRSVYVDSLGESSNTLVKISADTPFVQLRRNILNKQVDGLFCTDGTFDFDASSDRLVYVYHYRNQFITMDTNLNVIYTAATIDTNSFAKITVASVAAGDSKFSAPAHSVNKRVRISGGKVFILSSLVADNEDAKLHKKNDVIDVYDVADGNYLHSIYIPLNKSAKVTDFLIHENMLFTIDDMTLHKYLLPESTSIAIDRRSRKPVKE